MLSVFCVKIVIFLRRLDLLRPYRIPPPHRCVMDIECGKENVTGRDKLWLISRPSTSTPLAEILKISVMC